ncbi:hypothetical protein FACS189454_06480 [Planctomycetales bacterium]|nr:hypothetical protein FACS189454_06480 [Planctomycetales bacterium]
MDAMNQVRALLFLTLLLFAGAVFADDAQDRFNAAKTAFNNKQYETARAGFNNFVQLYPANAQTDEAKFWLAESFVFLGQYGNAETYYNQLVNLNNTYATAAMFRLGEIPYLEGKFDVAKPRLGNFVDKYKHDKNLQFVLYYLGDIAMRSDNGDEAEWYFAQCDTMFPEGAKAMDTKFGLAWAKNKLGKQTEASAIYQQLLTNSDPTVVERANFESAKAIFERNDFQNAITALLDFQRKYPASSYFADSQRVVARSKIALKDFEGALTVFSQISLPSTDDKLQKVRCLYGLKRTAEAQTALAEAERTAGAAYRDQIALLKSVFLFDQKDYKGTVALLETLVLPQYDGINNRMMFNYPALSQTGGVNKLSDEGFFKACSLLALAYGKNGDTAKANATLSEMQGQAAILGGTKLSTICSDTATQLANIGVRNNNPNVWNSGSRQQNQGNTQWTQLGPNPSLNPGYGGNPSTNPSFNQGYGQFVQNQNNQNRGQWSPSNNPPNINSGVMTTGTDLDRFWRATQLYDTKNFTAAAAQLEQILMCQYNQLTTPKLYSFFYSITNADGTLNEITFVKAASMLALAKAQLGDMEQANAIFTALSQRVKLTDAVQKQLFQDTYTQLTGLAQNGGFIAGGSGNGTNNVSLISETDQRRLIREANTLYNTKKYSEADIKLNELLNQNPSDANLAEALLLQSKTKYKQGQVDTGVAILDRIATELISQPQYADALWYLGLYYDTNGDTLKSVEYFQILADKFPNYKNIDGALYFLAADDLTNGTGRKANTYLMRVRRNFQHGTYWTHAVWTLAYEAYKKKEYTQADIYLQEVLRHPPDVVIIDRVLYLKGELALKKNDYNTAFLAFKEVARTCPESTLASFATRNAQFAANKTTTIR